MKPSVSFMINSFFENMKLTVMSKGLDIQNQGTEKRPLNYSNTIAKKIEEALEFQRKQKEWSAKEKQFFINNLGRITKDYLWLKKDILLNEKYGLTYTNFGTDSKGDYFHYESRFNFTIK